VRQSSLELVFRPRCVSDRSEVLSVHSTGSDVARLSTSDTTQQYSTTARHRPRYGTEYQRIDRRHGYDADDYSTASSTPQVSPYSVSSSSVFTFDNFSCDGDDLAPPPPPPLARARRSEPPYINIAPCPRRSSDSGSSTQVELNYAEIDLSAMSDSQYQPQQRTSVEPTPYAVIDLEATAAAAQTGREHARLREGMMQAKAVRRPGVTAPKAATLGRYSRPSTPRKSSMPSNIYGTLLDITRWPSLPPNESADNR